MRTFFSPSAYRYGRVAAFLVTGYLGFIGLLLVGTVREGIGDGTYMSGFAFLATAPWSFVVMAASTAIDSARGIPMSDQDGGMWEVPAFAVCAILNAVLFWVILRGRIRPVRPSGSGRARLDRPRSTNLPGAQETP